MVLQKLYQNHTIFLIFNLFRDNTCFQLDLEYPQKILSKKQDV
jgi:hypothetical protein